MRSSINSLVVLSSKCASAISASCVSCVDLQARFAVFFINYSPNVAGSIAIRRYACSVGMLVRPDDTHSLTDERSTPRARASFDWLPLYAAIAVVTLISGSIIMVYDVRLTIRLCQAHLAFCMGYY